MTGRKIQALVFAWQATAIFQNTLLHQFGRGDVLPPEARAAGGVGSDQEQPAAGAERSGEGDADGGEERWGRKLRMEVGCDGAKRTETTRKKIISESSFRRRV